MPPSKVVCDPYVKYRNMFTHICTSKFSVLCWMFSHFLMIWIQRCYSILHLKTSKQVEMFICNFWLSNFPFNGVPSWTPHSQCWLLLNSKQKVSKPHICVCVCVFSSYLTKSYNMPNKTQLECLSTRVAQILSVVWWPWGDVRSQHITSLDINPQTVKVNNCLKMLQLMSK